MLPSIPYWLYLALVLELANHGKNHSVVLRLEYGQEVLFIHRITVK